MKCNMNVQRFLILQLALTLSYVFPQIAIADGGSIEQRIAWTLAYKLSCDHYIEGYQHQTADEYNTWRERHGETVKRVEIALQNDIGDEPYNFPVLTDEEKLEMNKICENVKAEFRSANGEKLDN